MPRRRFKDKPTQEEYGEWMLVHQSIDLKGRVVEEHATQDTGED